jgi:(p)ppGpp synthase/HD superfamily hydrolase
MIAAAYLHDTVEDTDVEIEDIAKEFGKDVADLVSDLTDVSTPFDGVRAERKAMDREHTAKSSARAKTIKLADLISNSRSITQHDEGFAVTYMKEKQLLLPHLVQGNNKLFKQAERIIQAYYDAH